jgi:hypothetical protein
MTTKDIIEPTRFLIWLAIGLLSIGVCYAKITDRIGVVEQRIEEIKSDHDLLISISSKLSNVESDIKELKLDMKTLSKEMLHP